MQTKTAPGILNKLTQPAYGITLAKKIARHFRKFTSKVIRIPPRTEITKILSESAHEMHFTLDCLVPVVLGRVACAHHYVTRVWRPCLVLSAFIEQP